MVGSRSIWAWLGRSMGGEMWKRQTRVGCGGVQLQDASMKEADNDDGKRTRWRLQLTRTV